MRVLILGGTVFVSRALAEEYLARSHDVTCLARTASTNVPPGARGVSADRRDGVAAYEGLAGRWDCVVDVSSDPTFVHEALTALAPRTSYWMYVSSCSVYEDQNTPDGDESRDVLEPLAAGEQPCAENYGASKSACESWCRDVLENRLLIVRPGLIVGPGDPSDRGGYWPARFLRGESPVVVPAASDLSTQVIDVRDLASWLVRASEDSLAATLNAVGDPRPLVGVLEAIRETTRHCGEVVVAPDQWLLEQGVSPWAGEESLPLWIPRGQGFDGFSRRSNVAARRAGLVFRPFSETMNDVGAFEVARGLTRHRQAGLSVARERELLLALAGMR